MLSATRVPLLAAAVLVATSNAALPDEAVLLRYAPSKAPLIYRTATVLEQQQSLDGTEFNNEMTRSEIAVWTFQRKDKDGNFHWQSLNKRLKVNGRVGPLGKYAFDSTSSRRERGTQLAAALTPAHEALSGASFEVTLDPRGNIAAVKGYDGFLRPLVKDDFFARQYTFGGTDKGAKLAYQELFVTFSDSPVRPGQSWKVPYDFEIPALGRVTGKKIFTYDGEATLAGRKVAKITIAYDASIEADIDLPGLKVTGSVTNSESSGRARFDRGSGQLLSLDSTATFTGTVSLEVAGRTFTIPTTQTWTVSVERLDRIPEEKPEN